MAHDPVTMLIESNDFVPILAITLGILTGIIGIVSGSVVAIIKARTFEATRREVAAYVAEGTIAPQDAIAILNAGKAKWEVASAKDLYGFKQPQPA
jgi:hypothetical protein